MTKEKGAADVAAPQSYDLTLDDYCQQLSVKKVSPELIGGFHHASKVAGLVKAGQAAFDAAFELFVNQPA